MSDPLALRHILIITQEYNQTLNVFVYVHIIKVVNAEVYIYTATVKHDPLRHLYRQMY